MNLKLITSSFLISLLPLSQKVNVPERTSTGQPAVLHFATTKDNHFLKRPEQKAAPDIDKLKQSDWYSTVTKNMVESEYHFNKVANSNSYSAPNRKNNLRFYYDENGFTVQPRTTKIPIGNPGPNTRPDQIEYKTLPDWKVVFSLDKKQLGTGTWKVSGSKAEYKTEHMTVQYINNMEGMRQNFIVKKPLSGDEPLKLNFSVETSLEQRFTSERLQFVHDESGIVLNYDQLKVWDAEGKQLAAVFAKDSTGYSIQVESAGAVFPITIDPISTTPATMLESDQSVSNMGAVASAGDVNGDGFSDVIVGAYSYDNGQLHEGVAFIYHGSATGINTTAATMVESNQVDAFMGISVASAGDVNGDGYSDVIVGAYWYHNGEDHEGAAFIYHGSATGIDKSVAAIVESNNESALMGFSVAGGGDVNADGYSDVIVGAYRYHNSEDNEGAAFIYLGSASGIDTTKVTVIESNQINARMGFSVAGAGDVNADGYSDIIIGAYLYQNGQELEGAAFIYHGNATGIGTTAAVVVEGNQESTLLGYSVACAGDVNADGYSDVIISAYSYDNGQNNEGGFFICHGSPSGINATPATIVESNETGGLMGWSVASAGDVNGDGYSDVLVGSQTDDDTGVMIGSFSIYHGSSTGIKTVAAMKLEGDQQNAFLGYSVASAGDVNGDGFSDVIVGSLRYSHGQDEEGAAFVFHGSATGINTTAAAMTESNQANAGMGCSVASAGDVNGDGYSDVIVGALSYDNGQVAEGAFFVYHGSATGISTIATAMGESNQADAYMGWPVASAGDVNGDGYSDVIVGAPDFDSGQTDEGAAFIYHGSATGLNTTAVAMIEGNQTGARMGFSVATAGDVNGDGYSDVILGAFAYSSGQTAEGVAFIYHGSATGVNSTASAIVESNQAFAFLGYSVASAGDINGDGYSDVIVGARAFDNGEDDEGAAFTYHGSATGLNTTAAAMIESNQEDARMGYSVAGAGDVNGDGYSDVIVGAPANHNGQYAKGAAFIYHGSATGVHTGTAVVIENEQASSIGHSVAGAGDVNGDGYNDVILGANYSNGQLAEGAAFIYHGSATGIATTAAFMVEGNQESAGMGASVATAGDVNGDGYSDVIVGAISYSNGQAYEGAAFVYHGNAAITSNRNNLNLYNVDLTTPLNSSNFVLGNFGAGLFAKSFLGRNKGKLVWETKLSYNPYSGTPITNSVVFTSEQSSYTDLILTGVELKNLVDKQAGRYTKIRARVKYDPVTAITGQLYGPWRYVSAITAGTTGGVLPVDLISFKVVWQQHGLTAHIKFVTDNETEICCYEIEKSDTGFNFETIGHLDAKNTSNLYTYGFIDNHAIGKKQYYRLKIIHQNGTIDYSRIQLLLNDTVTEILVFPNPTADLLQLKLNKAYNDINVHIVSSSGRVVKQFTSTSPADQTIKISVGNLATGTYLLYLQTGEEKQVLQFVKE